MTTTYVGGILPAISSALAPLSSPLRTSTATPTLSSTTETDPVDSAPPSNTTPTPSPTSLTTIPTISTPAPTSLATIHTITTPITTSFLTTTITASAPTSTSPTTFAFLSLDNVTTCDVYTIMWTVSNPNPANLTDVAINFEVAGIGNNASFAIATNLPILSANFTWDPVNVPPGQYEIYGSWSDTYGATVQSQVFDVNSGSTTGCLANAMGTSSAAASRSSPSKAAIVGSTLGCIIFIICLAFVFRRVSRRKPSRRGGGWSSLDDMATPREIDDDNNFSASGIMSPLARFRTATTAATASIVSLDLLEKFPITPPPPVMMEHKAPWATAMAAAAEVEAIPPTADIELTRIASPRSPPESSSPRNTPDISRIGWRHGGGGGGGDAGGVPYQPPSSRRLLRTTAARRPVPAAYTPTPEELDSRRSCSEQAHARESGCGGMTFLEMMTSSSPPPSPPPSPGLPLLPSPPPSVRMSSPALRSSWASTSPLSSKSGGSRYHVPYPMPDPSFRSLPR